MKRICVLLVLCLLLAGCGRTNREPYRITYLDLFDTVTTVMGTAENEAAFREKAQQIHEQLKRYHRLFDIYHEYDGLNNLKTVNDQAGMEPVTVDRDIIDLLLDCKRYYELTDGKVNAAMGSVLSLWHEARQAGLQDPENAKLPDKNTLAQAAEHMDFACVIIDEVAGTVYITDPQLSLDVGAIAKGWACQKVAQAAPEGLLISVGGNVCATGPKTSDGTPWVVGVQDPDGGGYLKTLCVTGGAVVTSGDYQRTYTVNGKAYHHIIDPATQMPAAYWRSVTVVCADSGLADALSTALFLLPLEEGKALAARCNAQALWLDAAGKIAATDGFEALVQK